MKNNGEYVKAGEYIAKKSNEMAGLKQDITAGLPRVEELVEARVPKSPSIIAAFDCYIRFSKTSSTISNKIKLTLEPVDKESFSPRVFYLKKDEFISLRDGAFVPKKSVILKGDVDLQNLLDIEGLEGLVPYFTREIRKVYSSQGAEINPVHIEVILKYMIDKVEVLNSGDSPFIQSSIHSFNDVEKENIKLTEQGLRPCVYRRIILGITKSCSKRAFIAAASFQNTIQRLVTAALEGEVDSLEGMKESVIVGKLIPAGTGFFQDLIEKEALKSEESRDNDKPISFEEFSI